MTDETLSVEQQLAKLDEELDAAKKKAEQLEKNSEETRKNLLAQLREKDLEDVRTKCKRHGFTATDLRGFLKVKGAAKKTVARKRTAKKKV